MAAWTCDELDRIADAQELEIAPRLADGSLRKPVPIWVVRAGDDLYVRAAYGAGSGWHRVARTSREARIRAGDVEKDVTIEDAAAAVNDQVDAAYRSKYGRYPSIVDSVTEAEHRSTTLRLVPR
jgi:hypothetical protein